MSVVDPWTVAALKRDLRRMVGWERFEMRRLRTGPKSSYGRFAETTRPVPCEECNDLHEHFHVINDEVPYPWVFEHNRLLCHECYTSHWGETIPTTNIPVPHPRELFVPEGEDDA